MRTAGSIKGASLLVLLSVVLMSAGAVSAQEFEWIRQFGSDPLGAWDDAAQIDVEGSVYVAGYTFGTLPGQTSAGDVDAYVRKYDTDGNETWTRQFGTTAEDRAWALSVDPTGVYVAGFTNGTFPGETNQGGGDVFVCKYDRDGIQEWVRQFGTSSRDYATCLSVDSSGVYVAGATYGSLGNTNKGGSDTFVRKYDTTGTEVWTRQFGTSGWDQANGIAVHNGGVYIVGGTGVSPVEACDAFVCKYDTDGFEVWTSQFGTPGADVAAGVSVDATGVYVFGRTDGTLPGQTSTGSWDAFVRRYDTNGTELWTRQFGTSGMDVAIGISVHPSGVYVAGYTYGTFPGQTSAGAWDGYVRRYDVDGTELWTHQFGTEAPDFTLGVSVDASGVYVCGRTLGTLPGQTSGGGMDAFVAKLRITNDPQDLLVVLIKVVSGLNLHQGIDNSLDAKLDRAQQALEDLNQNNDISAINALEAFINEVEAQRGNKIPEADADALIALAQEILRLLTGGGAQSAGGGSFTATCLLFQNSPNPCRNTTLIRFQVPSYRLPVAGDRQLETGNWQHVSLSIYDISGRVVETLVDARLPAGNHHVTWETKEAPSGVYFYKLTFRHTNGGQAGDFSATRKMLVLK